MMSRELVWLLVGCVILSVESFSPLHVHGPALVRGQGQNWCAHGAMFSKIRFSQHGTKSAQGMVMVDVPDVRKDRTIKNTVLVAGATGRVGQLVVDEILLRFPSSKVRAVVSSQESMSKLRSKMESNPNRLEAVVCDLNSRKQVQKALEGVNQVVWCASGLSPPRGSALAKLAYVAKFKASALFRRALDIRGPRIMCEMLQEEPAPPVSTREEGTTTQIKGSTSPAELPRFVMLSSAAVTRPGWSEAMRAQYPEAAEIPIVKLNPLGILGLKLMGEEGVRQSGVPYTIVRSCGISTNHTPGQAFKISTGDTAVGQIHPSDLSAAVATLLGVPEATGKTVEMRTEGSGGLFGRGTKSALTEQMAAVVVDAERAEPEPQPLVKKAAAAEPGPKLWVKKQ